MIYHLILHSENFSFSAKSSDEEQRKMDIIENEYRQMDGYKCLSQPKDEDFLY